MCCRTTDALIVASIILHTAWMNLFYLKQIDIAKCYSYVYCIYIANGGLNYICTRSGSRYLLMPFNVNGYHASVGLSRCHKKYRL